MITIELFGVPRIRAGTGCVQAEGATVAMALRDLARRCPALAGPVIEGEALRPSYRLSLNGERFVSDPETTLADGDVLLLLAADVGG